MMNDYEKLKRAMRLIFNIDITPDDFLALRQLTTSLSEDKITPPVGGHRGMKLNE